MEEYELPEPARRLRRNLLGFGSTLVVVVWQEITIRNIAGYGVELTGVSTGTIVAVLCALVIYHSATYFSYLIEMPIVRRLANLEEFKRLYPELMTIGTGSGGGGSYQIQLDDLKDRISQIKHKRTVMVGARWLMLDVFIPAIVTALAIVCSLIYLFRAPGIPTDVIGRCIV